MKNPFKSFYARLTGVFLILLIALGTIQIILTVRSSMTFITEADQKLNVNLAKNIATEFVPFLTDSIDHAGIEHAIHGMMVINPRIEIYLLDSTGGILAFFAEPRKKVKESHVDLPPIREFLNHPDKMPIQGDDPRNPGETKIFSAAPLSIGPTIEGYLYIIIGSEQYDSATRMIEDSYIINMTVKALIATLIFTGIVGMIVFALMTKRINVMDRTIKSFREGKIDSRIPVKTNDEFGALSRSFNEMADEIVANMEELKKTDQLRRELIANVSHDLRSPLASIQGYLETILMKDEKLSKDDRKKFLETIFMNVTLLNKLVNDLFELSKLDAKQVQPKSEVFSIAELIQDVVLKFKPDAEKRSINLEARLQKRQALVTGDIAMIERVLSNLIENALRYTPVEGSVFVESTDPNDHIRVLVSDTGCGIPDEDLPHVFERFYRVEKSRNGGKGGTGLGLAIAKKIIDIHDGKIGVSATSEEGTTFFFNLKKGQAAF